MKKLLLTLSLTTLIGCGDASSEKEVPLPRWEDGLTLANKFYNAKVFVSPKGNCYLDGFRTVSKVDCEDFNIDVGNHIAKQDKPVTDDTTALLEYLLDYCVVNDKYKDFPRVKGASVIKELQGKELSCKLPDDIDKSMNERAEYLRLKEKLGG